MATLASLRLLVFWVTAVRANTRFIQPAGEPFGNYSDNPIYNAGEKIAVYWTSTLNTTDVILHRAYPRPNGLNFAQLYIAHSINYRSFTWSLAPEDYPTDIPTGENIVLYFGIFAPGSIDLDPGGATHFFNVSRPANLTSVSPESNSHLSKGAIASIVGITAGVMIAAFVLAMGVASFFRKQYRQRKQKKSEQIKGEFDGEDQIKSDVQGDSKMPIRLSYPKLCPELCADTKYLAELDAHSKAVSPCPSGLSSPESKAFTPSTLGSTTRLDFGKESDASDATK